MGSGAGADRAGQFSRRYAAGARALPGVAWLNTLRLRYDALTYRWQSWVTGFNRDQQFQLLNNLFGGISVQKFALVLLATWVLVLAPIAFSLYASAGDTG